MDKKISVLVVEDSSTMSRIIVELLQKLGFTDIDLAQDGRSALDRMESKQYDLVFSDWEMQPMGGEQLLQAIRQNHKISKTPVILITATSSRGASWLAGANAYLAKPFSENDLRTAIKSVQGDARGA
jgi:two-component system chemotaxis response regulator CheY